MLKKLSIVVLGLVLSIAAQALTPEEGQLLVAETFKDLTISTASNYCIQSSMTCRSLYTYKNKETGKASKAFTITFYSAERQAAASEYYIPTGNGKWYNRIVDLTYNSKLDIERADEVQQVTVTKDKVTIHKLYMPKLGTSEYVESDLIFAKDMAYLDGASKDKNDPNKNSPIRIEYPFLSREVRK